MFKKFHIRQYNLRLLLMVTVAIVFGIIMVNSANPSFTKKNIIGATLAICVMLAVTLIDYRRLARFSWLFYVMNLLILLLVRIPGIGYNINGATRWIRFGGIQFQPSEFSKVFLIIFVAAYISERANRLNTIRTLGTLALLMIPPLVLIKSQPDLSTTLIIAFIMIAIVFLGGLSMKLIAIVSAILVPTTIGLLWYIRQPWQKLLHGWQQRRVLSFFRPQDYLSAESYQQLNSMLAIGSGKLWGNGLNNDLPSSVKNANYLPEPQTDFIFAIIGEDLGFAGTVFTIIILLIIVYLLFGIARRTESLFGRLLAGGTACYIGLQTFVNIGVVTLLLPNTGLPLPFISYGLTSLFSSCILIGICLNIDRQNRLSYTKF
ncbi:MAG: FtsW/RodA/SpoVE family cell cycle protein [Eubacteriales bacterium]|nr:FtsW/RodA/SpoVE family cell cycle protein [Eubacteriales bacterium]